MSFLDSDSFQELNHNLTSKFVNITKSTLNVCSDTITHFGSNPNKLIPINCYIPRLYGLPEIHNDNISIRPVVSYINSPAPLLSRWLNDTLRLIGVVLKQNFFQFNDGLRTGGWSSNVF